jgi:hypothetical protein
MKQGQQTRLVAKITHKGEYRIICIIKTGTYRIYRKQWNPLSGRDEQRIMGEYITLAEALVAVTNAIIRRA